MFYFSKNQILANWCNETYQPLHTHRINPYECPGCEGVGTEYGGGVGEGDGQWAWPSITNCPTCYNIPIGSATAAGNMTWSPHNQYLGVGGTCHGKLPTYEFISAGATEYTGQANEVQSFADYNCCLFPPIALRKRTYTTRCTIYFDVIAYSDSD